MDPEILSSIEHKLATGQIVVFELIRIGNKYYENRIMFSYPNRFRPWCIELKESDYPTVAGVYGVDLLAT